MRKTIFTVAICGMLFATSCKKEETVVTTADDGSVTTTETTTTQNVDLELSENAKARLDSAEVKLAEAKAKGDKEAERVAQITVDKAKSAWEATKAGLKNTSEKIKEEAQEANAKMKASSEKAKEDAKEGYNEALEKAKIK